MLVAVGSVKGSPGVTSLAVALAARWPTPAAVVVEADPAGGDLAFRFGHQREPGLSELAADARAGGVGRDLAAYTQRLSVGADVVLASAEPEAVPAVRLLAGSGLGWLRAAAISRLVVVDVGRLEWDSPAWPLVGAADVLLLVMRAWPDAVDAVQVRRDRLLGVAGMRASVRLGLVGDVPYPLREVERAVGLPVAGRVPDDRRGAAVLAGRTRPGLGWTRLEFLRAARALAAGLHAESSGRSTAPPSATGRAPATSPVSPAWLDGKGVNGGDRTDAARARERTP